MKGLKGFELRDLGLWSWVLWWRDYGLGSRGRRFGFCQGLGQRVKGVLLRFSSRFEVNALDFVWRVSGLAGPFLGFIMDTW